MTVPAISVDSTSDTPLHRQLYESLRGVILGQRLRPGRRLPSTRALAADLGVSRNTVVNAFEQLLAEGYLEGKSGAGTYVTRTLPEESLRPKANRPAAPRAAASPGARLSRRAREWPEIPRGLGGPPRAFRTGPALDLFPRDLWARLASRLWRRAHAELLGYERPFGYQPLREASANRA